MRARFRASGVGAFAAQGVPHSDSSIMALSLAWNSSSVEGMPNKIHDQRSIPHSILKLFHAIYSVEQE